jgi:hypothetical protein
VSVRVRSSFREVLDRDPRTPALVQASAEMFAKFKPVTEENFDAAVQFRERRFQELLSAATSGGGACAGNATTNVESLLTH